MTGSLNGFMTWLSLGRTGGELEEDLLKAGLAKAGAELRDRAFGDDGALVDDNGVRAESGDVIHKVGGEENCGSLRGGLGDEVVEEVSGFDVEAVGGLVEHKEAGLMEHGEEEAELLLHAAGVVLGVGVDVVGETEVRYDGIEAGEGLFGVEAVHSGAEREDLVAGEVGVEDGLVGEEADEALDRDAVFKGVEASDLDAAAGRFEDAHEQAKKSRLTGTVGAEQAADLAGGDSEADVLECGLVAEGLHDVIDGDELEGWGRGCGVQIRAGDGEGLVAHELVVQRWLRVGQVCRVLNAESMVCVM